MVKGKWWLVVWLLLLWDLPQGMLHQHVLAEEVAPTLSPPSPPSPTGVVVPVFDQGSVKYLVKSGGFVTQPEDQVISSDQINSIGQFRVNFTLVKTTEKTAIGAVDQPNHTRIFMRQGENWQESQLVSRLVAQGDGPVVAASELVNVGKAGTDASYQLALSYTPFASDATYYSRVFHIRVVSKPVVATALTLTPTSTTALWGQGAAVEAKPTPEGSTTPVTQWDVGDKSSQMTVSGGNARVSYLQTPVVAQFDQRVQQAAGMPIAVSAQVGGIRAATTVTVGGLVPLSVKAGTALTVPVPALENAAYPSEPTFLWHLYAADGHELDPDAIEGELSVDQPRLKWQRVTDQEGTSLSYQLEVQFAKIEGGTPAPWWSNIAPITIEAADSVAPPALQLVSVPRLTFGSGTTKPLTLADFQQEQGVTLGWQSGVQASENQLTVLSSDVDWQLSVAIAPFVNQAGSGWPVGAPTVSLWLADGTQQVVVAGQPAVTLYRKQAASLTTTVTAASRLTLPGSPLVRPGHYQAKVTWTLTRAP